MGDFETVFTNAKAGMDGVDMDHVKRVVLEMSRDSPFYAEEMRKQEANGVRARAMAAKVSRLAGSAQMAAAEAAAAKAEAAAEASRDVSRTFVHVDMDAFYVAVEQRDNPRLRGVPCAVGGSAMLSTASYEARRFGVRSAMPGFIASRLCPELVVVRHRFDAYREASEAARAVFVAFDARFESMGMDEATLDVTGHLAESGRSAVEVAEEIRRLVKEATRGLSCSCGVACTRMLAKVCSDINKPDGQYVLAPKRGAVLSFLRTLPVRKIPGIGKMTEFLLREALNVVTCGDLWERRAILFACFSAQSASFFVRASLGVIGQGAAAAAAGEGVPGEDDGERGEERGVGQKGIGVERTFRAMSTRQEQDAFLRGLVGRLCADVSAAGLAARTWTLKLKTVKFEVRQRSVSMPAPIPAEVSVVHEALQRLLRAEQPLELRLMGVRATGLAHLGKHGKRTRLIGDFLVPVGGADDAEELSQQLEDELAAATGPGEADAVRAWPGVVEGGVDRNSAGDDDIFSGMSRAEVEAQAELLKEFETRKFLASVDAQIREKRMMQEHGSGPPAAKQSKRARADDDQRPGPPRKAPTLERWLVEKRPAP